MRVVVGALLCAALCVSPLCGMFEGSCLKEEPAPGVLVVAPGSHLSLACDGQVLLDGVEVPSETPGDRGAGHTTRHVSPPAGVHLPDAITNIRMFLNRTRQAARDTVTVGYDTQSAVDIVTGQQTHSENSRKRRDSPVSPDAAPPRLTGGDGVAPAESDLPWRLNGRSLSAGEGVLERDGGPAVSIPSVSAEHSGRYSCHHRGRVLSSVKVIVAAPPEKPILTCYKRSPSSKIRCDWTPQQPIVVQPHCYLYLNKGTLDSFSRLNCSFSGRLWRCWCALDHREEEKRVLHMAYLCVTSIAGNATSTLQNFTPLGIIKPEPPSAVAVRAVEGQERMLTVTWGFPCSWKRHDQYYELIYEIQYRPSDSIKSQRYTITDVLPMVEYVIQLRAKDEYDGLWTTESEQIQDQVVWHHALWISGLCVLLCVTLAVYALRHREKLVSKLHRLNVRWRRYRPRSLLSAYISTLNSLAQGPVDDNRAQIGIVPGLPFAPQVHLNKTMWDDFNLPAMIKRMRNSSSPHACFTMAFLAPFSWDQVVAGGQGMDAEDYDGLMWAAKPFLQNTPPADMTLPQKIKRPHMERMMQVLKEVFGSMSETKRGQIKNWVRQRVTENDFDCTLKPKPLRGTGERPLPEETEMCDFFKSQMFSSSFTGVAGMKPALARRFLGRIKKCAETPMEFSQQLERLGMLACYYRDDPPVTMALKKGLLTQLKDCDNSGAQKLPSGDLLSSLGTGVTMLSPDQLTSFNPRELKAALKKLGTKMKWKRGHAKRLAKKLLQGKLELSAEDLVSLGSAVRGVPNSILKKLKPGDILGNGDLENVTEQMTNGQKEAIMEGLRKKVNASELIRSLPDRMLSTMSLRDLEDANLTSLVQVEGKRWNLAQSAFLLKKLNRKIIKAKQIRRLGSAIQGMTCRMMDKVAEKDAVEMADALTETPQWLSKIQVGCAAHKLFGALESKRSEYFKDITEQELDDVPTLMLIHLPARKIRDLPDSICPAFLSKMSVTNLSSLSLLSPSRPAITKRGRNMSELSGEEILDLGQLLCWVPPSQLARLGALNDSLEAMAGCRHIPPPHRQPLLRLLKQTYGNVSDWDQETMEAFGPLLLLDDSEITNLGPKSWLKAVLSDLKDSMSGRLRAGMRALKKKLFVLRTLLEGSRRRRAVTEPTVQTIEELEEDNVFWDTQQLEAMSAETFTATVETLGSVTDYTADQLAVLVNKSVAAFGPFSGLNESMVTQLGCLNQGIPNAELQALNMSLETLEELSDCGWLQSQREAVWKGFSTRSGLTAAKLGAPEIVSLNQFICGLSSEDIGTLQQDAFRDAVSSVGEIQCPLSAMQEFKKLALTAFGEAGQWSEATVSTLGNIVAGLNASELSSLDPAVFSYLSKDSITSIPTDVFSALSIAQLKALGPDNSAMVSPGQKAALGPEKVAALEEALMGSRDEETSTKPPISPGSGAPSLTIEGIAAFMKPFLFLFLGLLLL
ncbi:hypothetical protein NHX12_002152 [Muraenolepis orangiensis]|uniref:Fibronectin type-III domain-containing protein n=1 Tax=Muraenolepis orangiensis TaxID=630683 RepID=A0A9Q0IFL5_9TELE|nr:hypothetical protein NHX12_002152 [Muraenolepis orangiensis]